MISRWLSYVVVGRWESRRGGLVRVEDAHKSKSALSSLSISPPTANFSKSETWYGIGAESPRLRMSRNEYWQIKSQNRSRYEVFGKVRKLFNSSSMQRRFCCPVLESTMCKLRAMSSPSQMSLSQSNFRSQLRRSRPDII